MFIKPFSALWATRNTHTPGGECSAAEEQNTEWFICDFVFRASFERIFSCRISCLPFELLIFFHIFQRFPLSSIAFLRFGEEKNVSVFVGLIKWPGRLERTIILFVSFVRFLLSSLIKMLFVALFYGHFLPYRRVVPRVQKLCTECYWRLKQSKSGAVYSVQWPKAAPMC